MAATKSNIPSLIRAVVSHRKAMATTLPRPHHNLHRHSHPFLTSFLNSHPSNLSISNPHLSTAPYSRRVHSRATALDKNPVVVLVGNASDEKELRGQREQKYICLVPDMYREGHTLVFEVLIKDNDKIVSAKKWPREFQVYLSATEVLADEPQQLASALLRNDMILAHKVSVKPEIKGGSELSPELVAMFTRVLKGTLNMFQSSPNALQEGHSVFIKGFKKAKSVEMKKDDESDKTEMTEDESDIEEDESDIESNEIKEDEWAKSVTCKTKRFEYHMSAEVVDKHDERYMPREATVGE